MRLNADGSRDLTFNATGSGPDGIPLTVVMQGNAILLGGHFEHYNGTTSRHLVRISAEGVVDTSFKLVGTGFNNGVRSILPTADGRVVVGGYFTTYNEVVTPSVMRLLGDPILSAADVTFGDQTVGTAGTKPLTVTNAGSTDLIVSGVSVIGGDFAMQSNGCGTVAAGSTCVVQVQFTPGSPGAKTGSVVLTSNSPAVTVGLSGTGTSTTPPVVVVKPAKPTGLTLKATTKQVKATWRAVSGATGYTVTAKGKKVSKTAKTTRTSLKIKARFIKKTNVKVCVTATNAAGSSPNACKKAKVK